MRDFWSEETYYGVTGLDFASLYPSIIMDQNLSPETIVCDIKEAKRLVSKGIKLNKIKFECMIDEANLPPGLENLDDNEENEDDQDSNQIEEETVRKRTIRGWAIAHQNDPEKMGIFPTVLKRLFDKRAAVKKELLACAAEMERIRSLSEEEQQKRAEEYETLEFKYVCLNSRQYSLKICSNTCYGESGNRLSPLFLLQMAGGVTSYGQKTLRTAIKLVEDLDGKVYYGDSVSGDTPVLVRYRNQITGCIEIDVRQIDSLDRKYVLNKEGVPIIHKTAWFKYDQFKLGEPDRIHKQFCLVGPMQIWSNGKWAKIKKVIRHCTNKKMFRVNTHTGCVDVTEDHSLLTPNLEKIKPADCEVGTELLHSFPDEFETQELTDDIIRNLYCKWENERYPKRLCSKCNIDRPLYEYYKIRDDSGKVRGPCKTCVWTINTRNRVRSLKTEYYSDFEYLRDVGRYVTKEEAFVWGMFMADGSCGHYNCPSGTKHSWAINNQNLRYLNTLLEYLAMSEPHFQFKLLDTLKSSGVYKLVAVGNIKLLVEKYRKLFYHDYVKGEFTPSDSVSYKIVPTCILNASKEIRRSYYDGYYMGDGCKTTEQKTGRQVFACKGKIGAQGLYYLVQSLGYEHVSIRINMKTHPDVYWIGIGRNKFAKNPAAVKKLIELPSVTSNEFVYDIETDAGIFAAGVGSLNILNTDSCYIEPCSKHFVEIDRSYFGGNKMSKLDYVTKVTEMMFPIVSDIQNKVNEKLRQLTGAGFLKMAYEEILYLLAIFSKKKYLGVAHTNIANFKKWALSEREINEGVDFDKMIKDLFIRGVDIKKRNASKFAIKVVSTVVVQSMQIHNIRDLRELVVDAVHRIYDNHTAYVLEDFIASDQYKPDKKNVKVQTFVERYKINRGINITPYIRYKYVIAKKPDFTYDYRGRKQELSIGDRIELYDVAKQEELEIDLGYYMKGSVNGMLARLIAHHSDFYDGLTAADKSKLSDVEIKLKDDRAMINATKSIEQICSQYQQTPVSKGPLYQGAFRKANKIVKESFNLAYKRNTPLQKNTQLTIIQHIPIRIQKLLEASWDKEELDIWLIQKAEKEMNKLHKDFGERYVNKVCKTKGGLSKKRLISMTDAYIDKHEGIVKDTERRSEKQLGQLVTMIKNNLDNIFKIFRGRCMVTTQVSDEIKKILKLDDKFNEPDATIPKFSELESETPIDNAQLQNIAVRGIDNLFTLEEMQTSVKTLKTIYVKLCALFMIRERRRSIVEYLKILRLKTNSKMMVAMTAAKNKNISRQTTEQVTKNNNKLSKGVTNPYGF